MIKIRTVVHTSVILTTMLAGGISQAGPWMSRSTLSSPVARQGLTTRDFDVTVSLAYEAGAEYPTTINEQRAYEEVLGNWARGVFEASDGYHRISNIRVFRDGRFSRTSDLLWTRGNWPKAYPAGVQPSSDQFLPLDRPFKDGQMVFADSFDGTNFVTGSDEDRQRAGAILTYLWTVYAYGLMPEGGLSPDSNVLAISDSHSRPGAQMIGDSSGIESLMANPWQELNGGFDAFNLSSQSSYTNSYRTAQYRMWQGSAWETLTRPLTNDPMTPGFSNTSIRVPYPELSGLDSNREAIIGNSNSGFIAPEIIWASEDTEYAWVLDISGSMGGQKIVTLKDTVTLLSDLVEDGDSVGIVTFDSIIERLFPLTSLNFESRVALKAAIASIYSRGWTAMYGGAFEGLAMLEESSESNATKVLFLLSDGQHNTGPADFDGLVSRALQLNVPIFTFAYGDGADSNLLANISSTTGGEFYFSPTDQGAITRAFLDANQAASERRTLLSEEGTIPANASLDSFFSVDSGHERIDLLLNTSLGGNSIVGQIITPTGSILEFDTCQGDGISSQCSITIGRPQPGIWRVVAASSYSQSIPYTIEVTAIPEDGVLSPGLTIENGRGTDFFTYPEPAVITVRFSGKENIANANAFGALVAPNGVATQFGLHDDGLAPDVLANDGVYTALLPYQEGGNHTVAVSVGADSASFYTDQGAVFVPDSKGKTKGTEVEFVEQAIARHVRRQFRVIKNSSDDAGDAIATASFVNVGSTPKPFQIDTETDVDLIQLNNLDSQGGVYSVSLKAWKDTRTFNVELLKGSSLEVIESETIIDDSNDSLLPAIKFNADAGEDYFLRVSSDEPAGYFVSISSAATPSNKLLTFDFERVGDPSDGWSFSDIPSFTPTEGRAELGALKVETSDSDLSVGIWESPRIGRGTEIAPAITNAEGTLYRAGFHVESESSNRILAPTLRFRSSPDSANVVSELSTYSRLQGDFSPGPGGRLYSHYFRAESEQDAIRLFADVINVDPADKANAKIRVHQVQLEALSDGLLSDQKTEASFSFANSEGHDWIGDDPVSESSGFLFEETPKGLRISHPSQSQDAVSFGFWTSPISDRSVVLEEGRLYEVVYTLTSDATAEEIEKLMTVRCRINTEGFEGSALMHVEPGSSGVPAAGNSREFRIFLVAEPELAGKSLLFSFDAFYVSESSQVDPSIGVILENLEVLSFQMNPNGGDL